MALPGDDADHSAWTRFPFWSYNAKSWSLEHIHAQAAEGLTRREQWLSWLDEHRRVAESIAEPAVRSDLLALLAVETATLSPDSFRELAQEVLARLGDVVGGDDGSVTHGLGNLALLTRRLNSELGNSAFARKRRRVIEADRSGELVPIATHRVFLKYYSVESVHQAHYWGHADQLAYTTAIATALDPYLLPGERA
jgi:hypothetical protein